MTRSENAPNWSVALEFDNVAITAARIVSAKYRDNAVGALAEFDDMYQEALILLATKFANTARELNEGTLRFRLVRALDSGRLRRRAGDASSTLSLDEVGEHRPSADIARGIDGQSRWNAA